SLRGADDPGQITHTQLGSDQQGMRDPQPGRVAQRTQACRLPVERVGLRKRRTQALRMVEVDTQQLTPVNTHEAQTNARQYVRASTYRVRARAANDRPRQGEDEDEGDDAQSEGHDRAG